MFQCRYKHKNQSVMCTMCTFMCTLKPNGTHLQAFKIKAFSPVCTMCTIHAHTHTRKTYQPFTYIFKRLGPIKCDPKKHTHVRETYLNGTHGTHLSESFIYKGFPVFTFSKNPTHNGTQVHIDNKNG